MILLFLSLLRRELEGGLTSETSGNLKLSGNPELCLLFVNLFQNKTVYNKIMTGSFLSKPVTYANRKFYQRNNKQGRSTHPKIGLTINGGHCDAGLQKTFQFFTARF